MGMGGGMGNGGTGLLGSGNSGGIGKGTMKGNATMQGRKLEIKGLTEKITDDMISKYFQKYGQLEDWGKDREGDTGFVTFAQPFMLNYCIKTKNHQIDGSEVEVQKAKPFEEVSDMGVD